MEEKSIWNAQTQDDVEAHRARQGLTFTLLRMANVARRAENAGGENSWRLTDWTNALAGETGELCNIAKKLNRRLPGDPSILRCQGRHCS